MTCNGKGTEQMHAVLLIDFGSTCTKVTAADTDARTILGTAQDFTTVKTDVSEGLECALKKLQAITGPLAYQSRLACSSAAGGLKMLACGLVPGLTAQAARMAALGAGAKVIKTYSYQLTSNDAEEIAGLSPDIFLLTGGTDGGNSQAIIHNAKILAGINVPFPVIVAGNRTSGHECLKILAASVHPVLDAENVMPVLGSLHIAPAQQCIRTLFLERIIAAKGLGTLRPRVDILMPTPAAVLAALVLLAQGPAGKTGIGDLMAADLGGATTDIYSLASGMPESAATVMHGLPEPYAKRTVEGDIGMRAGARGVIEAAGMGEAERLSGLSQTEIKGMLDQFDNNPMLLPDSESAANLDYTLAALALKTGFERHAGMVRQIYTPSGAMYLQTGKDLTNVRTLILTGGALVNSGRWRQIAEAATRNPGNDRLMPREVRPLLDRQYILSAMGLLQSVDAGAAYEMMVNAFGRDVLS
jgi:uncharacterized protein (TIGR01319 family)